MNSYIKPRAIIIFIILLIPAIYVNAKDNPPMKMGEVTANDFKFNVKDYPEFEGNASAVILCDYGQEFSGEHGSSWQTRTVIERRVLILNNEGLKNANVNVWFEAKGKSNSLNNLFSSGGKYGPFWVNGKGQGVFKVEAKSIFSGRRWKH